MNSKLKKCLSFLIASLLAINFPLSVVGIDTCSEIFTYIEVGDTYNIDKLVANYQELLSGTTEITLPETYNNKPCTTLGMGLFKNNNYFTKIIFPKTISNATGQLFDGCTSIKEVIFECGESFIFMPFSFRDCTSLEKIYVYAETLSMVPSVYAFTNVPSTAIIYVKNETVKNQLTNWPGTIVVDPSLGSKIYYTELDTAIADAEAIDTTKYTEDSVKTLTDAIAAGKAVRENADATQEDVDAAAKSITDAIAGLVEASSSVTEYLWTGTFTRKVGVETTSIADGMTVKNNSGNYMTFSGVDLSEMTTPTVEILYTGDSDTVFISTSSWAEIGKGTSTADTVFAIPDSYKSTTSFIVTTNNQSSPYGTITSVRFYDAAVSQKTVVATYEVGSENASDVIATLYDDGSMVISGTGAMADYSSSASKSAPWNQDGNISKITSIEVQNGVTAIGNYAFRNCTAVTSITLAESVTTIGMYSFHTCTSLKSVYLPNSLTSLGTRAFQHCTSLESINIPTKITTSPNCWFMECTNPNLVIDFQNIQFNEIAEGVFRGVTGTIKTYSQGIYDLVTTSVEKSAIVDSGKTTAMVVWVKDNMSDLKDAISDAATNVSWNYTEDSYKVLSDAVASGNALLEKESVTSEEIEKAIAAINNAVSGLVSVFYEFDTVLAQAEDLVQNHKYEYTYESWLRLSRWTVRAKEYKESITGEITEYIKMLINEHKENMLSGINGLVALDKTEVFNELVQTIETAESYDKEDFTEESYAELASALEAAKLLTEEFSFEELALAKEAIETALGNLEIDPGIIEAPGDILIKVYKGGVEAVLDTYTADDITAGVTKIRVTFDCAEDVDFWQYASIELKATVGTTENWKKYTGSAATSASGQTGCVIELPLTNAIVEGDKVKLTAYTYAWNGAADYVYAVTKVEFFDAEGHALYAITDRTIAYDDLQADIAKAEKIEQGDYTDESFAVLQTAIGTAKLVADNAEKAVIDEAREALSKAIEGLTTEPIIVTGKVSGTIKVSDSDDSTEMTVTAVSSDGTETTVTATSMGTYTLENLEAGSYTLTISGGKYADRSYEITVTEGENTQDVELNPYGDINGDGKITTADVGMANSHAKGVITLTDYGFACADVKTDGSISTADVGMINSHAKSVSTLW